MGIANFTKSELGWIKVHEAQLQALADAATNSNTEAKNHAQTLQSFHDNVMAVTTVMPDNKVPQVTIAETLFSVAQVQSFLGRDCPDISGLNSELSKALDRAESQLQNPNPFSR